MPIREVRVPNLGDFGEVPVVEVLVGPGDAVKTEEALVTLESDKATMDVPAPSDGVIREISVGVGDSVSEGHLLLTIASAEHGEQTLPAEAPEAETPGVEVPEVEAPAMEAQSPPSPPPAPSVPMERLDAPSTAAAPSAAPRELWRRADSHATPSLRRFARSLGVNLAEVPGTGRKGRILEEDVRAFVKLRLSSPGAARTAPIPTPVPEIPKTPEMPEIDFSRFGEIEVHPLSRIKRISGPHLRRAWNQVPHVTHHDEADITALEAFRQSLREEATRADVHLTFLTFALKALARAVREFPEFNSSLDPDGRSLILKKYVNIGVAVDTPNGLVVPVVRAVEAKGVFGVAGDLGELGARARQNRLKPRDLEGGTITVSNLGGIGGTAFSPIVNAPEVAILGLARSRMMPVWDGSAFRPRLMQPLDLSYDHRVIDGAQAARFVRRLAELLLEDPQRLLL